MHLAARSFPFSHALAHSRLSLLQALSLFSLKMLARIMSVEAAAEGRSSPPVA